jgi:hypothetical protein
VRTRGEATSEVLDIRARQNRLYIRLCCDCGAEVFNMRARAYAAQPKTSQLLLTLAARKHGVDHPNGKWTLHDGDEPRELGEVSWS